MGEKDLPPGDSPDQQGVRNAELDDRVQLLSPLVQELIQLQEKVPTSAGERQRSWCPRREEMLEQQLTRTISACFTVRGKPSRRKPFLQGGESRLFSISSTTISSLTWGGGTGGIVKVFSTPSDSRTPRFYTQHLQSCSTHTRLFVQAFLVPADRSEQDGSCVFRPEALPAMGVTHHHVATATFHARDLDQCYHISVPKVAGFQVTPGA